MNNSGNNFDCAISFRPLYNIIDERTMRVALELSRMNILIYLKRSIWRRVVQLIVRTRRQVHRMFFLGDLLTPVVKAVMDMIQSVIDAAGGYLFQTLYTGQYKGHFSKNESFTAQHCEELKAHRH